MDKEVLGILVSYKVKVTLVVSRGGILGDLTSSDVSVEMPVILMHPKPPETISSDDILVEDFARQKLAGGGESDEEQAEEGGKS